MGALIRTSAILFTDMVSSTELRSRLGDERAEVLRKHHDELLARVVDAHGGEVLRWTGDGIKATFASASDALAAAVEVRREVHAYGRRADAVATFDLRIGVAAGEVLVDDGDHHGVPVIEAARLEALARPAEILVTDVVRVLASRRTNVVFEEVGERVLKGLDDPVTVHRVVDPAMAVSLELPKRLGVDDRLPLVGRDALLARFADVWNASRAGRRQSLFLRGSAGIGRTRAMGACARIAHADGAIVLAGSCSVDLAVPYEPFVNALRDAVGLDPTLDGALHDGTGSLARLFPGSAGVRAESQPSTARFELFDAVAALLRRLARTHPVLLAIDDLHLASSSTVLLLGHLLDELPDERLTVLATLRADDLDGVHPARDLLATRRPSSAVIDLTPFTEADVAVLVRAAAPGADVVRAAELARLVMRESAGTPLFASALVEHVADAVAGTPGQLSVDRLQLPASVHELVLERLAHLPASTVEVLTCAAVIGDSFDIEVLAEVLGRSVDEVLDVLEMVQRTGIVDEVGLDRFGFSQAMVRTALLEGLTATRRARHHRRIAEALEQRRRGDVDELAFHWRQAGDDGRATTHLADAARRDLAALAYESAKARYQELVDLLARDTTADTLRRAEAWLGLGAAGRALGDTEYTKAIMRAARLGRTARSPSVVAEAAALSTWPGTFFFIAEMPEYELIELCEDALTTIAPDDPMRVRVLSTLASHLTFDDDRDHRVALITEANQLVPQHDDPLLAAMVLNAEFLCLWEPATLERREQISREMGRIARTTGDPEVEFLGGFFGAYCATERGELTESRQRLVELLPIAESSRNRYFSFLAERLVLSIDIARRRPDVGVRIDALLHAHADTMADTDGTWALQTGGLGYQDGTLGSMVNTMEAMTTGNQARTWTAALALARLWAGDREGAARSLREQGDPPKNYFWVTVMQVQAEVATAVGDLDRCADLYEQLHPYRGRVGVTASGSLVFGLLDRSLGQLALALGRTDEAISLLTAAVEQARRTDLPMESVVGRRLLATALHEHGRTDDVSALLRDATVIAERHGFGRELRLLAEMSSGR